MYLTQLLGKVIELISLLCLFVCQVTVPSDLTVQVVSALGDLQKFEEYAHLEWLHQLLVTTQEVVFEDIAPYWGTFCSQYTSPDGSTFSIPNGMQVLDLGALINVKNVKWIIVLT